MCVCVCVCVSMDAEMKEVKIGIGRRGVSEDYLVSCRQMTWFCVVSEDLRAIVGHFVEM